MTKVLYLITAVASIALAIVLKGPAVQTTCKYRVVATLAGTPPKLEIVFVDITSMTEGTGPGQYTCNAPFLPVCVVTVNDCTPDGYLDPPTNSKPFYYENSPKIVSYKMGTFTTH